MNDPGSADRRVRFACRLLVDSQYLISFRWGNVLESISRVLGIDTETVRKIIEETGLSTETGFNDLFQVVGVFSEELPENLKSLIFESMIHLCETDELVKKFVLSLSLNYALTKSLINSLVLEDTRIGKKIQDSPLLAMCTSDLFLQSTGFNSYAAQVLKEVKYPDNLIETHIGSAWFIDLMEMLSHGTYGMNSYEVTQRIKGRWKDRDLLGVEDLIDSGQFLKLLFHKGQILSDSRIRNILENRSRAEMREKGLTRFYTWLGIGNDFSLGLEFLVGSLEFLPNQNEFFGVVLFIIGSIQLTARAIISIVSRAHIEARRKKIKKNL